MPSASSRSHWLKVGKNSMPPRFASAAAAQPVRIGRGPAPRSGCWSARRVNVRCWIVSSINTGSEPARFHCLARLGTGSRLAQRNFPEPWPGLRSSAGQLYPLGQRCLDLPDLPRRGGSFRRACIRFPCGHDGSAVALGAARHAGNEGCAAGRNPEAIWHRITRATLTAWATMPEHGRPFLFADRLQNNNLRELCSENVKNVYNPVMFILPLEVAAVSDIEWERASAVVG